MHRIGNEVDDQPMNTQLHMQSNTVFKVENEMEQPSSHKTKHRQYTNGVVKTVNKLEQLPPNTKHHKQSTTMLKVENEMEHQSSHKTKHHQHSNGTLKALNKMGQLSSAKVKSATISSNASAYSPSSSHRDVTRAQKFAAQQHAASTRDNFYKRGPTYNVTKRQLVREVDEIPQSKEECLERLRKLRDELAMAERLEQKTSPSVTTSESSLGSVPDEEGGDTKKKKRRNPIHKARKMLGRKKPSEQGEQMNNR
ncbi:hypothetical protein HOLleu_41763 [Holothuria leucospilota]|uniref:Uncharacterized protein n=1 Tax=Holothuria leucospilota TaxID=206669 RepID=A0A9Q1BCT7_HOLLE|nr:hypothetical protein HOLleu_41763 [Holothuria leucospilota]